MGWWEISSHCSGTAHSLKLKDYYFWNFPLNVFRLQLTASKLGKVKPQIKAENYLIRMIELGTRTKEMCLCWLDRRGVDLTLVGMGRNLNYGSSMVASSRITVLLLLRRTTNSNSASNVAVKIFRGYE